MMMRRRYRQMVGVSRRLALLRIFMGAVLTATLLGRPVRLESVRWWRSSALVRSLGLSADQAQTIDRLYRERLLGRRRCIERLVAASNRVNGFMRDGQYDADTLQQTQEMIKAAADERAMTRILNDEVMALLSPEQQRTLARLRPGRIVE